MTQSAFAKEYLARKMPSSPGALLESAVELTSILAGVNEEMANNKFIADSIIVQNFSLKDDKGRPIPVSKAERLGHATTEYLQYEISKGMSEAIKERIITLRRLADYYADEQIQSNAGNRVQLTKPLDTFT